jgi:hypothetical protein
VLSILPVAIDVSLIGRNERKRNLGNSQVRSANTSVFDIGMLTLLLLIALPCLPNLASYLGNNNSLCAARSICFVKAKWVECVLSLGAIYNMYFNGQHDANVIYSLSTFV